MKHSPWPQSTQLVNVHPPPWSRVSVPPTCKRKWVSHAKSTSVLPFPRASRTPSRARTASWRRRRVHTCSTVKTGRDWATSLWGTNIAIPSTHSSLRTRRKRGWTKKERKRMKVIQVQWVIPILDVQTTIADHLTPRSRAHWGTAVLRGESRNKTLCFPRTLGTGSTVCLCLMSIVLLCLNF